jgi:hypothetical protein
MRWAANLRRRVWRLAFAALLGAVAAQVPGTKEQPMQPSPGIAASAADSPIAMEMRR